MSTRGAIARYTGESFTGVYHHWDSYPEGLGQTLWHLYHKQFHGDLSHMLATLIDAHPAGWSTINGADWTLPAGYGSKGPQCYCHGERQEEAHVLTQENAGGSGVEYVYAFDEQRHKLYVLSSYSHESGRKMIGMFGSGDPDSLWAIVATLDLRGAEPDWKRLQQ